MGERKRGWNKGTEGEKREKGKRRKGKGKERNEV